MLFSASGTMKADHGGLVSVVIPTYNRAKLLLEALESVFHQTYDRFEVIVVDDGSTDGTSSVVSGPNLVYLSVVHTGLPGLLRNIGIRRSQGAYIAFLDSDDLWEPTKLARQVALLKEYPETLVCHSAESWIRNEHAVSQASQKHRRKGYLYEDSLRKCIISPSTVMLDRRVFSQIGLFREDIEIAEDYELWLRVTAKYLVGYIDEPLATKRGGHSDQLSQKYGQIEIFRIHALTALIEGSGLNDEQQIGARSELARKCRIYAAGCLKRGRHEEAARYAALARTQQAYA